MSDEHAIDLDDTALGPQWAQPDELENFDHPGPLFDGDTGSLSIDLRRTIVSILKKRYIAAEQHPSEWRVLLDNEDLLRSRFHDMFLNLIVDQNHRVAYKRQAQPDSGTQPFPTVLYDQAYTREETILLVKLRMLLRGNQTDDPVFVDLTELLDEVASFRAPDTTNHVAAEKVERKAVERLQSLNLLLPTHERDRFQVAPILEVLMSVSRLGELIDWLVTTRGGSPAESAPSETPGEESDEGGE